MVRLDVAVPWVARCRMAMRRFPFAVASGVVAACTQLDVKADEALGGGVADDDRIVPSPLGCQRRVIRRWPAPLGAPGERTRKSRVSA